MPLLLVGLVVGLIVSVFQAVTQIQEQSLSFIPKIVGVAVVIVVAGPWMLGQLLDYTEDLYALDPGAGGRMSPERCSSRSSASSRSPASSSCSRASRRCSCSRRCSPRSRSPARVRAIVAVGARGRLCPTARAAAASRSRRRARARRPGAQGAARRARLRARDRRAVRRGLGRRLAPRHADRLLLRRARRPADRQPVGGVLSQLYGLVAIAIFIAIGGDAWVIAGLARTFDLVPLTAAPDIARSSRASPPPSRRSSPPRSRSPRRCCSRSSSPTPRSASSRASCRSSTSSRSASRPRSPSACCSSAPRCRSSPAGSPTSSSSSSAAALHALKVGRGRWPRDKTEKATPKKRDEARKKGQVARSQDLNGAVVLLARPVRARRLRPRRCPSAWSRPRSRSCDLVATRAA